MKSHESASCKKALVLVVLVLLACLIPLVGRSQLQPLSENDITLLLTGGAKAEKIVELIHERGINFKMTADLAKKFYNAGASNKVLEALQVASSKVRVITRPSTTEATHAPSPSASSPPTLPRQTGTNQAVTSKPIPAKHVSSSSAKPKAKPSPPLSNPSPAQIQQIIQDFAAKEQLFKQARDNYTYHQINKVDELNSDGDVVGTWEQDWDILFNNNGTRYERVTYAPVGSLKRIMITEQDLEDMRSIQPFVLTTKQLPLYDIKYQGHVRLDQLTTYVFSVRPKEIKKGHEYFQGIVWVDDHDLQIVKSEGRMVPQIRNRHEENLFPRFTTWRQQIDGKYWFPTFTEANDTLYFSSGPVPIREIIRYTDYKQFKSKARIIGVSPINEKSQKPAATPKKQK